MILNHYMLQADYLLEIIAEDLKAHTGGNNYADDVTVLDISSNTDNSCKLND